MTCYHGNYKPGYSITIPEPVRVGCKRVRSVAVEQVYTIGDEINAGEFGTVHKALHKSDPNTDYAVKVLNIDYQNDEEATIKEVNMLRELNDIPSVVQLVDFYIESNKMYIFQELGKGGDALDRLHDIQTFEEKDARLLAKNLLEAVNSLHSRGIVHRDLKLDNILMSSPDNHYEILLCDFGYATKIPSDLGVLTTFCGTPAYTAPEIINGDCYNEKVDMWSIGCIIYSLLCGYLPFGNVSEDESPRVVFDRAIEGDYDFYEDDEEWDMVSGSAKKLISGLLVVDPKDRLSAAQALDSKWFTYAKRKSRRLSLTPIDDVDNELDDVSIQEQELYNNRSDFSMSQDNICKKMLDEDFTASCTSCTYISSETPLTDETLSISDYFDMDSSSMMSSMAESILEIMYSSETKRYTLQELRSEIQIPGVDYKNREKYLSEDDFQKVFQGATKTEVATTWRHWQIRRAKQQAKIW